MVRGRAKEEGSTSLGRYHATVGGSPWRATAASLSFAPPAEKGKKARWELALRSWRYRARSRVVYALLAFDLVKRLNGELR